MAQGAGELDMSGDEVPPLEDMSEYVEKVKALRKNPKETNKADTRFEASRSEFPVNTKASISSATKPLEKEAPSTFGGFKKGFLFSSSASESKGTKSENAKTNKKPGLHQSSASKKTKSSSASREHVGSSVENSDGIPFVKPKSGDGGRSSGLEFPEVQEAMKEAYPLLKTQDWITDDLLKKIEKHPLLSKVFQDQRLAEVLSQFHSNPQRALAAARENPEVQRFLQEFCALMGDHFTTLADREEGETGTSQGALVTETSAATSSPEETQMREILQKPEVQRALADPHVQELIATLKNNPDQAQRMLQSSSPEFQQNIQVLIDHGLLGIQRF